MDNEIDNLNLTELLYLFNEIKDEKYAKAFIKKVVLGSKDDLMFFGKKYDCLFYEDEKGISLIEYIFSYNIPISGNDMKILFSDIRIIRKAFEYGVLDYSFINKESLFQELEPGRLLIDVLFESNLILAKNIESISDNVEVLDYIVKYSRYDLLKSLHENILFNGYIDGKRVIDYMFERDEVDDSVVERITSHTEIYELCNKYNKPKLIDCLQEQLLITRLPNRETTLLDEMIESNVTINCSFLEPKSYDIIIKHERYDLLEGLFESDLLKKLSNSRTVLEVLLEKGQTPRTFYFSKTQSFQIIHKYKRFDLFKRFAVKGLVSNADLNDTYLDLLIKEYLKDPSLANTIARLKIDSIDSVNSAKEIMILLKYDVLEYLRELTSSDLLRPDAKGRRIIDELIKIDKDLTIKKVLNNSVLSSLDLVIYLKIKGIKANGLYFKKDGNELKSDYLDLENESIDTLAISEEYEEKLDRLRKIFLNDNKSDTDAIETMIRTYRKMLHTNNPHAIKEIDMLIRIKEKNPNFSLSTSNNQSYYSAMKNGIFLSDKDITVFSHEVGHAFFDIIAESQLPEGYEDMVTRLRGDSALLDRVSEFAKKYEQISNSIEDRIEEEYFKDYEEKITPKRKKEIEEFLSKTKKDKIQRFSGLGYSHNELAALISDTLTYDEYIKQDKKIKKMRLKCAIMNYEYPYLAPIADILDAIYEGKLFDGKIVDNKGNKIELNCGHGINYYITRGISIQFDETIANYSTLSKTSNPTESLGELRSVVGDEFVEFLSKFYENKIVNSMDLESERSI